MSGSQSVQVVHFTSAFYSSDSNMTLASLFGTWRAKGLNPFLECRRLLISPQV